MRTLLVGAVIYIGLYIGLIKYAKWYDSSCRRKYDITDEEIKDAKAKREHK